jgi:hypothetical protein
LRRTRGAYRMSCARSLTTTSPIIRPLHADWGSNRGENPVRPW